MLKRKHGFSLIELIVVMAVVAILVLIATPRYLNYTREAKEKRIIADVKTANNKLAEYMLNNDSELPDGNTSIPINTLISYIIDKKIYDITGIINSINEASNYTIIPNTYIKKDIGSKLKGSFIASSGGDVYYIDSDYTQITQTINTPIIKFRDSKNPDQMLAIITYSKDSIAQEYKINDDTWLPADIKVIGKNKKSVLMQISASEYISEYTFEILVPNGSTVYARAIHNGNQTYETKSSMYNSDINLSTQEKTYTLFAEVEAHKDVVTKEYKVGSGEWTKFSDKIFINKNATIHIRGKDVSGNIIAYSTKNISNIIDVQWFGLPETAFDRNLSTTVELPKNSPKTITWSGDLSNKVFYLDFKRTGYDGGPSFFIKKSDGTNLSFYDTNGNIYTHISLNNGQRIQIYIVMPQDASSLYFSSGANAYSGILYDIHEVNDLEPTSPVTNLSSIPYKTSMTLNWANPSDPDFKTVWIFKDGEKIGASNTGTFTDIGLWSNTSYTYELKAVDTIGNLSKTQTITDTTLSRSVHWSGIDPEAFDFDNTTSVSSSVLKTIKWTGDLTNKVISIDYQRTCFDPGFILYIKDAAGKNLSFYDTNGNSYTSKALTNGQRLELHIVMPANAASIVISSGSGKVYDIHEMDDMTPTGPVTNVRSTPDKTSMTLNWTNPSDPDFKTVWIFRDGEKIGASNTGTFTDIGLWSNTSYTYELKAVDTIGNLSKTQTINDTTLSRSVYWSGIDPEAFDFDNTTSVSSSVLKTIKWTGDLTNKVISIDYQRMCYDSGFILYIKDAAGKNLSFYDTTGNLYASKGLTNGQRLVLNVVMPANAASIVITSGSGIVYDVHEMDDMTPTSPVTNLKSIPNKTSMTLNWTNPSDPDFKTVWVFRDGELIGKSNNGIYTDKPLYSKTNYTYQLIAVDTTGNLSTATNIKTTTLERDIYWNGLEAGCFDGDVSTNTSYSSTTTQTITWTGDLAGRVVYIDGSTLYVRVKDASGKYMAFYDTAGNLTPTTSSKIISKLTGIVIPEGATSITIGGNVAYRINDIYEDGFK